MNAALGGIVTMIIAAMLLTVGVITYAGFQDSVDTTSMTNADASAAINKTADNTFAGFNIASNLPLVIAAGAVISIVIGAFAYIALR